MSALTRNVGIRADGKRRTKTADGERYAEPCFGFVHAPGDEAGHNKEEYDEDYCCSDRREVVP